MSNWALESSKRALQRHGLNLNYTTKIRVVDPNEGTATETSTTYSLRIYPKHIQATQYNFPTLVGKDTVMFYLAADSLQFQPKVSDTIEYLGKNYRLYSYTSHIAQGEIVLYKILGVNG